MNDNKSCLSVVFNSDNENFYLSNIKLIFENIQKLNKGILISNNDSDILMHIDNKYYNCSIELNLISVDKCDNTKSIKNDGLIVYGSSNNLQVQYLLNILNKFNDKPNSIFIIFDDDRNNLNSLSHFQEFHEFCIDKNIEIICSILEFQDINEDDGIGALNMSLQTCQWSNSVIKNKTLTNNQNNIEINKNISDNSGYQSLKDEAEYDNFLEKVNGIRNMNKNENISDEQRRINAENAIFMLAKYFDFGEESDDHDQDD